MVNFDRLIAATEDLLVQAQSTENAALSDGIVALRRQALHLRVEHLIARNEILRLRNMLDCCRRRTCLRKSSSQCEGAAPYPESP